MNLACFRPLDPYVTPDTKIDLNLFSRTAEMDYLKEHVQVVEVEEIDENSTTGVF